MTSHHGGHPEHHHKKSGSLTNVFKSLFKTKEKGKEGQTDTPHKDEDNKKMVKSPSDSNASSSTTPRTTPPTPANTNTPPEPPPKPTNNNNKSSENTTEIPTGVPIATLPPVAPNTELKKRTSVSPPKRTSVSPPKRTSVSPPKRTSISPPKINHNNHVEVANHDKQDNPPHRKLSNPPTHSRTPSNNDIYNTNNNSKRISVHEDFSSQGSHSQATTPEPTEEHGDYTPLPFYEGSPKNMHANQTPQKPRASGPPEILPEEIEYDSTADFLGQGSFGSVYKGRCRGQEVAVKIPRKQKLSLSELTSFRNEVKIMSKIYHPNVVLFLGACTQMGKMQIVTERCTTDLEKLLASKRPLSLYERMRMAKDAALGMNWLHGITRIVHNDLKSANLLVDNHMRIKVTDFGFSSIKEGDQFVDKAKKGTPLWMAPEVMMGQPYDDRADVYSFGIILWEIVTRDVPYKHHNDYNTFSRAVCQDHERPPLPADTMPSLKYLITNCWDHDSKLRPSFNEIVFRISEVMVECMIENDAGRQLWKKYFLLPKQELFEQIPWPDFAAAVGQNLGLKSANESAELLANVKRLLIALPQNTMGLVHEVVTMDKFDKVIKWFGKFFDPVCGPGVIKEINILATQSWFHWDISRDESTSRLAGHEEGTFLVRLSSTDPKITPFTLSLTGNQHRRIKRIPGGQYKLQGKPMIYHDLPALVELCQDYRMTKPCPKIDTTNPYAIDNFS